MPFGFNHVPHENNTVKLVSHFQRLHCLSASTTFRTRPRLSLPILLSTWSSLPFGFNHVPHINRPMISIRTMSGSSLPFGFNHVPHKVWPFQPEFSHEVFIAFRLQPRSAQDVLGPDLNHLFGRLHCLSASTTFRTSLAAFPRQIARRVFIAFRLQPRSARPTCKH